MINLYKTEQINKSTEKKRKTKPEKLYTAHTDKEKKCKVKKKTIIIFTKYSRGSIQPYWIEGM